MGALRKEAHEKTAQSNLEGKDKIAGQPGCVGGCALIRAVAQNCHTPCALHAMT